MKTDRLAVILKASLLNETMTSDEALAIKATLLYVNGLDDTELEAFGNRYGSKTMNTVMELIG